MVWILGFAVAALGMLNIMQWKHCDDLIFENQHLRKVRRRVELVWGHVGSDFPILTDTCQWIAGDAAMPIEAFVEYLERQYPGSMQP